MDTILKEVITLTVGDCAENHVQNQRLGQPLPQGQGFQRADLEEIEKKVNGAMMVSLSNGELPDACVLVLRNGINVIMGDGWKDLMYEEQKGLDWDKKVKMYGRVVNKHARHNLCYDTVAQEPCYEEGKGRIIALDTIPRANALLEELKKIVGAKFENLKMEGNRYYSDKCGIGYHGDSERVRVCGIRLGTVGTPIHFQWFLQGEPVGDRITIPLEPGDIYFMSEKAVGNDWKRKKIYTLRHAVGAEKYTVIEKEEKEENNGNI